MINLTEWVAGNKNVFGNPVEVIDVYICIGLLLLYIIVSSIWLLVQFKKYKTLK